MGYVTAIPTSSILLLYTHTIWLGHTQHYWVMGSVPHVYLILQVQCSPSLHQYWNNFSKTTPNSHHQWRISILYDVTDMCSETTLEGTCTCTIKASSSKCHIVPYHLILLNHTYSYILNLTSNSNTCQVWITHSITEWWDQCHMFTTFCRSSAAPAFTSSETTSVLPFPAASVSGESPHCVMTDMCSETLMTGREGSLHTQCVRKRMVETTKCVLCLSVQSFFRRRQDTILNTSHQRKNEVYV